MERWTKLNQNGKFKPEMESEHSDRHFLVSFSLTCEGSSIIKFYTIFLYTSSTDEPWPAGQTDLLSGLRVWKQRLSAHHPRKLYPHLWGGASEMLSFYTESYSRVLFFFFHIFHKLFVEKMRSESCPHTIATMLMMTVL